MVKYLGTAVTFEEIPDEVTLAIEITNCPGHCEGCHSPWLREDIGEELTPDILEELIKKNDGITCVCFMGEGNDIKGLLELAKVVRNKVLKAAIYSGREEVPKIFECYFNYIKVGPYIAEFGPLNVPTTNQRLYKIGESGCYDDYHEWVDITYKFWKRW